LFEKSYPLVLFQQNNNKSKLPLLLIIFLFSVVVNDYFLFQTKIRLHKENILIFFGYLWFQTPFSNAPHGSREYTRAQSQEKDRD
jgi:hypothetical protein